MKTAIITGASAGMGREFALHALRIFPEIECFWLIARREGRLKELAGDLGGKKVVCMSLDLCDEQSFDVLEEKLRDDKPEIALLINNAGCGYLGNVGETPVDWQTRMTKLNVTALTAVTSLCVPYMARGGHIVNVSSIASFCPNPRMTVYSSTKSYVSAFTRGIREELRAKGVTATAVCPGPMDTEFIEVGKIKGHSKTFDILPYCDPSSVAEGTLLSAKEGRAFYTPKAFYKLYKFVAKVTPQALMVKFTKT
ncbi:MAG: SDR family NAD(P)-dependent oxidoreductase [Oscillospiraceae bacterium]|nr:SDR family NAD(P)-dependent oxidoreductase [Oscillospiraceae bacterium]